MASLRNGSPEPNGKVASYPVERFVTDFSRLMTDVNRLMTDLSNVSDRQNSHRKTKRERQKPVLDDTISSLREHARSFVTSAMRFHALYERVPCHTWNSTEKPESCGRTPNVACCSTR